MSDEDDVQARDTLSLLGLPQGFYTAAGEDFPFHRAHCVHAAIPADPTRVADAPDDDAHFHECCDD